ncbi:ATP-dependent helicase HrpB [Sporocytophaga myxococcoides]|uniref:ATP-dependent helicase HrpB n=1 Tax=Sporocytophaga myxococcoides TaxID=153721 RepID=A0A098LGK7_9BACT|nr:ATP-dependent helicase HrpB [Sporocytophaga myxococcoides]GAL85594.1 ATP-dependent helicase HrpB [Sporocytophaga myxococcoides]
MSFNPLSIDLPVREIIPTVQDHLHKSNTLIVNAPPGAGKSTLLPLAIFNEPWLEGKKVLMLEPRRLAAKTIAERMSSLLGEEVGQSIGYRIRFENKVSNKTRIEVLTEGILTRFIHSDNSLEGIGLVIFDEFHERSIHADVAMALCREAQQRLRPDLRIMVMSATLDMPQLTQILKAPVAQSKGKQYPVEIKYTGEADQYLLPEMTAKVVMNAVKEKDGDTLVFLPGEADIKQCEGILRKELKGFVIHPLYGMLPPGKQYSAIMPDKTGKRKVVLATSIAETSLTIEGVKIVVDSGFGKTSKFDPQSGLSRLATQRISKDSADQRAGRAGRLSPGICYRMWSENIQENMTEHRIPEIMEADLSSLVLDMAQWGIVDPHQLTWLTPPPKATLAQAVETLHQLNALENGRITDHGRKIHSLPCHPRIAHMLLMAEEENRLPLATDLAAILEERDPLKREAGIDINLRIEALRRYRKDKGQGKQLGRIEKVAASYRKLFEIKEDNGQQDPYETGVLLAHCHPERIAFARPGNNAQFQLANGKYASASHKDELAHESWLAIANLDAREGMGKIFLASPLNPKDLAPLVKEQEVISWDTEDGTLKASKDLRIGSIVLKSKPLPPPDDKFRIKAISDALKKEGDFLLPFTEEVKEWQKKILQLKKSEPQNGWPDVSTSTLLLTNYEWLTPYLTDIEHPDDLYELDLLEILQKFLTKEQKERLS